MSRTNRDVARLLREYATLLKLEEGSAQAFRVRAYGRAVDAVQELVTDIEHMTAAELLEVEGIGASTAKKIREYVETGSIEALEKLRATYPAELVDLLRIPGMGPKTVIQVRSELGVENVEDLKRALADERLRDMPGFGARSEEKLARSIERLGLGGKDRRTPIIEALRVAEEIVETLGAVPQVERVAYCGSLRRFRDTIGDVDIVVAASDPTPVMTTFVSEPNVVEILGHGETKSSILIDRGLQIDLRVVAADEFGAATLYFTGSKAHNIELRQRAIERGLILNEYALADAESGAVVASRTEAAIYEALGLEPIPPELREGVGEIDAAAADTLPDLVEERDVRGDLHVHSTWSGDGRSSLEDMVGAAVDRGLEYIAMTEHGEDLAINGLSRSEVRAQRTALEELRALHPDLTILHGVELNIGPDGGLDYDQDFLMEFEWCVASVHSHFDLDQETQTERLLRVIANPAVNAIGHLTGRRIGTRPGIEIDVSAVFEAAAATGTAIEINCALQRLDVPADLMRMARDMPDLRFVISTDSHHTTEFDRLQWGVRNARRGWVERGAIVNTWARDSFLEWVEAKHMSDF